MATATYTYIHEPGTSTAAERRDAVRITIGDTAVDDATRRQVSDQEIAFWLTRSGNDIWGASLFGVDALIARWARAPQVTHGANSVNPSTVIAGLVALRETIQGRLATAAPFWAGGQTISGKDALDSDSDAVQPRFARGQDSNPGTASSGLDDDD